MRLLRIVLCLISTSVWADENSLPEPLSFDYALSLAAEAQHPDLQRIDAEQQISTAQKLSAESAYALNAEVELRARWIEPSALAIEKSRDDHRALLRIQKTIYDFGRTQRAVEAEDTELQALKHDRQFSIEKRKIDIARRYFDVILSDLQFAWQDEAMATAYVNFDRVRDQNELGLRSDVDLLRAEADYQKVRMTRYQTEIQQRRTRALLAKALNRTGQLSSHLLMPELQANKKELPEYETLLDKMLQANPQIKLAKQRELAAIKRLQASRIAYRPELSAELDVAEYSRNTAGNNDWRAGFNLTIPLFENQQLKSKVALKRAEWLQQKADLTDIKFQAQQDLLELWQNIKFLKVSYEQLIAELDARELRLDKSRALYEMEVKTDLGNAMVDIAEMQFKQAQLAFDLAVLWMQLHWMLGEKVYAQ